MPSRLPLAVLLLASLSLRAQLAFEPDWRCLGPANMSGRIVDLAVDPKHRATWYVASASGGLFRTRNAGTTWDPVFDSQSTISIGAVAIAASNPQVIWVGTGEANARNSVSWGDGVYLSRDGGDSWQHAGLKQSFQIGAIAIHPQDDNIVLVAACGRLWGPNEQRGVFLSRDAGENWRKVLWVNASTGAIDVVIDPADPDQVYAATYERQRGAYDHNDPVKRWGPGSGLWKSADGGETWRRTSAGLPSVAIGRVGLALSPSDPKTLYALVETERSGWATGTERAPAGDDGKAHKGYGTRLGGQVHNIQDKQQPDGLETGGVFRSDDRGESWRRVNSLTPRPFYFSQIRIDPTDPDLDDLSKARVVSTGADGSIDPVNSPDPDDVVLYLFQ